ncbi:hypothetical protein [Kitasatospora sp. GAS1066B]|uniref:hypothetical protein n=1 Tax=Kitasatospora sp. GAS1066B TaxID=3156271 RepID=UPI00351339BF
MTVIVYDTGVLIALVNQDRRARTLHKGFVTSGGHAPIVPGPALSQAWRTSTKIAYSWKRLLDEVFVHPGARTVYPGALPPRCLPCAAGLDTGDWKTIGDMIGAAVLPAKKRPDPVDALAVFIAITHGGGTVLTTDREDIEAYAATLPGCGVDAVTV